MVTSLDPRWELIRETNATCSCCGLPANELLSFAYDRPDVFPHNQPIKENFELLETEDDILTEDFCRLDRYRFIRCVMNFPLEGLSEDLSIGVWSTTSRENFERMIDMFDSGQQGDIGDMGSWLSNPFPAGAEVPIAVTMRPQNDRQRPLIFLESDHPHYHSQVQGMSFDALAQVLKGFGHDLKGLLPKHS